MLPELKPFFEAVEFAARRRLRALESTFVPGINVWYRGRDGAVLGPARVVGRPRHDAKILVADGARKRWIKCSRIVAKGNYYRE